MPCDHPASAEPKLLELAQLYGIACEYWDYAGQHQNVSVETLQAVLNALGVKCSSAEEIDQEITAVHDRHWLKPLPDSVIAREDQDYWVKVHLPHGEQLQVEIFYEDGEHEPLAQIDHWVEPRWVEGKLIGEATFLLPAGTRIGWHRIEATYCGQVFRTVAAVTPARLPQPPLRQGRAWGIMHQFYSGLSADSWGIGDAYDLAQVARWAGENRADFVLINPVHASQPVLPLEDSPYLPCSRQFWNPIYIRPELILEAQQLSGKTRDLFIQLQVLSQLPPDQRPETLNQQVPDPSLPNQKETASAPFYKQDLINRNWSWYHKLQALELIYQQPMTTERAKEYALFRHDQGEELAKFALWCALVEEIGFPLPPEYRSIENPQVLEIAHRLSPRADFYSWVQWQIHQQLQQAQKVAKEAGMSLGIMHDLAVGIHGYGADLWANPNNFVTQIEVGAPADMYNQLGQNWSQPPWDPRRLEETAYQPLRDVVRAAAKMGGALRIDHIMGLFRLWWIPRGHLPKDGTYVRYNHEAMVGVLLLECAREGVQVVGEDLGTVEPWVREYLSTRGILGTGVLWFEFEGSDLLPPDKYRPGQLVAANTHDMPPSAGYWANEDLRVREALNLLDMPKEQAYAHNENLRATVRQALQRHADLGAEAATGAQLVWPDESGDLPESFDELLGELIKAQYRYICRTPAQLVVVTLADLVKQRLTQNQPGTCREYPNWRIPLTNQNNRVVKLEELFTLPFAQEVFSLVEEQVHPVD